MDGIHKTPWKALDRFRMKREIDGRWKFPGRLGVGRRNLLRLYSFDRARSWATMYCVNRPAHGEAVGIYNGIEFIFSDRAAVDQEVS